jgi:hypothetical protein
MYHKHHLLSFVIGVAILLVACVSFIIYQRVVYEPFSPSDDNVKKIVKFVLDSVSITQDTYAQFLSDNKITEPEYSDYNTFVGLVILKKLKLLNPSNVTKLLS